MLDKVLFVLLAIIGGLLIALIFTYKEMEIYYNTFVTVITVVSFILSLWGFFKNKD